MDAWPTALSLPNGSARFVCGARVRLWCLQDATEREKELQDSYAHLLEELDDARSGRVRAPTAAPATGGDMEDA